MRTSSFIIAGLLAVAVLLPASLQAAETVSADSDKVVFYEDPVFKPLNKDDEHPMTDLTHLAENGDVRAQFILGDLYAKGKGGLVRNTDTARRWFSLSAINGYGASFIRLAALAKRKDDMTQAYSWYDLGADLAGGADARYCATARNAITLTDAEKDKADELSRAWRKEKAATLNAQAEAEKEKRKAEEAAQASQKQADDKKTQPAGRASTRTGNDRGTGSAATAAADGAWTSSTKKKRFND